MNDFVGNILQNKFYACCYILLSVAWEGAGERSAPDGTFMGATLWAIL